MYEGQPLSLKLLLPTWLSPDNFIIMAAAGAAGIAVYAVGASFTDKDTSSKRLKMLKDRRAELRGEMLKRGATRKRPESTMSFMRKVVNRFQLLKSSQVSQVQKLLNEAGFRSKDAIVMFMFFQLVLPIVFGIAGLFLMGADIWGVKYAKAKYLAPIGLTYLGLKLPTIIASRRRKKRYLNIQKALADTLDLMTICAEAGLSLNMALDRVSRELALAYPEMGEELAITSMELGFLPERNKALLNLTERVTIPEVRGIISVLIQTEKYGTPIAQALRVLSAEFREQRMLRAENKAARLPAIMTVPMICFILPTLFIVIIAPAAIKIMNTMK